MKEIMNRLKSPVVIVQLVTTIAGLMIFFAPESTETIQTVTATVIAVVNIFAGLNNPADKENF